MVLINTRESYKINAIERQIRMTFTPALIPDPKDICAIQLNKLISKVKETEVREKDIAPFIEGMMADFADLSKEDIIKKFISAEFNRFIEYYDRAGDLNVTSGKGDRSERSERGNREDRKTGKERRERDSSFGPRTRFFVSLGKRDGLNPGGLLRVICDATGLKSASIGRIDVMPNFSFFEADKTHESLILGKANGTDYEGHSVMIEITQKKREDDRRPGGGGAGSGSRFGRDNSGRGERKGGFGERKGGFNASKGGGKGKRDDRSKSFGNRRFTDKPSSTIKNY